MGGTPGQVHAVPLGRSATAHIKKAYAGQIACSDCRKCTEGDGLTGLLYSRRIVRRASPLGRGSPVLCEMPTTSYKQKRVVAAIKAAVAAALIDWLIGCEQASVQFGANSATGGNLSRVQVEQMCANR